MTKTASLFLTAIVAFALGAGIVFFAVSQQTDSGPIERKQSMQRFYVEDAQDRDAVCNDGSSAVYYYRPGTNDNTDKWIIHLKGGGSCASVDECLTRWRTQQGLMTSTHYAKTASSGGIMSPKEDQNPDFYDFNHVRIMYCSSDTWAGNNVVDLGGQEIQFRGKSIVQAVLEDLQNDNVIPGTNLADATEVLFTGSSAGGGGMMKNLDAVAEALPHAEVKGVNDSAWNILREVGLYSQEPEEQPEEHDGDVADQAAEGQRYVVEEFHNQQLDESCLADNEDEPWLCASTVYSSTYLETPFFLYMDQLDGNQVRKTGVTKPYDADEEDYLENFAATIRSTMEGLDQVFSTQEGKHTALTSSGVFTLEVDGVSYYDVLTNWYFDREGPTKLIQD